MTVGEAENVVSAGIVINNLLFTKTEKAVIIRRIDREELPHLAIFFKTASGDIDGHLKDELAPIGADPYTPLFRIPAERFHKFETEGGPQFAQEFLKLYSKVRKARPGWLKRNGYVLGLTDSVTLQSAILDASPKYKGKHRVDLEKLKALLAEDPSRVTLLDPSALHSTELKSYRDPILAVRGSGKNRIIGLCYAPWKNGKPAWLISNSFVKEMPRALEKIIGPQTKEKARQVWYKVHDALQLAELGIVRD